MTETTLIKVWDPLVRFFHWALVSAFTIAYFTEEDLITVHSQAGYLILLLLVIRFLWGFIGTTHARFSDFLYSPDSILQFLKDTFRFNAKRYLGHNPAGGAMIILLMFSLLATVTSGILLFGADEHSGPLAYWFTQPESAWSGVLEEIHEFFANFTLFLVFIHIAGVLLESFIHKENLVSSMINGFKRKQITQINRHQISQEEKS